jgi:RNA polymerase sigma-70 factor (ECF subfamily)
MIHQIYRKIDEMPDKRKEVFKMAYIDGMKNDEIAASMNISIHTVKEHKGKALQSLRQHFSDKQMILFLTLCTQALEFIHRN